jgi:hypothetical protein
MQTTSTEALLILVFRSARGGRRPNLTAFCKRHKLGVAELQVAFDQLEGRGLLRISPQGESLTLEGLAVAAALSRSMSRRHRPLVSCRSIAA